MASSKHNVDQQVFAKLLGLSDESDVGLESQAGATPGVAIDIGSGAGGFVEWLNRIGFRAFGVECSDSMLGQAKENRLTFAQTCGVGQALPIADGVASVATFMNSLHHVPADVMESALAESVRIVAPGGHVYVLEPVAEGPGYQTSRLVDDEAEVRMLAQQAMDRWSGNGLIQIAEGRYENRYVYRDLDTYVAILVGIDGSRAEQVDRNRDAIAEAFYQYGAQEPDGMAFDHPMHYRLFAVGR